MTDRFLLVNGEIIRSDGEIIELTAAEAALLGGLWKHRGFYISRSRQASWLYGNRDNWPESWAICISVHYSRLRHKTAKCSFTIEHKTDYGDQFRGCLTVDDTRPHEQPMISLS